MLPGKCQINIGICSRCSHEAIHKGISYFWAHVVLDNLLTINLDASCRDSEKIFKFPLSYAIFKKIHSSTQKNSQWTKILAIRTVDPEWSCVIWWYLKCFCGYPVHKWRLHGGGGYIKGWLNDRGEGVGIKWTKKDDVIYVQPLT